MNDWISVKDALPRYGYSVLCIDDCGAMAVCFRERTDVDGEHWEMTDEMGEPSGNMFSGVTHWRALPEHPATEPALKDDGEP